MEKDIFKINSLEELSKLKKSLTKTSELIDSEIIRVVVGKLKTLNFKNFSIYIENYYDEIDISIFGRYLDFNISFTIKSGSDIKIYINEFKIRLEYFEDNPDINFEKIIDSIFLGDYKTRTNKKKGEIIS